MGMFSGIFGGGGEKPNNKPRNEGGNFVAIPPDQGLSTTEEEADIIARNAQKK